MSDLNIRHLESELERVTEERDAYAAAIANASVLASEWEGAGRHRHVRSCATQLRAALAKGAPVVDSSTSRRGPGPHPVMDADLARAARAVADEYANSGPVWGAFTALANILERGA